MNRRSAMSAGEAFLRRFHRDQPGVTPRALGSGRLPDGRSSYRWLADQVTGSARVLDLACGDGALLTLLAGDGSRAGVDMSRDELALAAARPELAGTVLAQGRAQELPFPDGAFDACVSHMALMLMDDLDVVAAELARVLVPGGLLALVLGAGSGDDAASALFRTRLVEATRDLPDGGALPAMGDRRTRTGDGLDEVLAPAGFAPVTMSPASLDLGGNPAHVWTVLSGVYNVAPLSADAMAALRSAFESDVAAITGPDGRIPCATRLNLVTTRRL